MFQCPCFKRVFRSFQLCPSRGWLIELRAHRTLIKQGTWCFGVQLAIIFCDPVHGFILSVHLAVHAPYSANVSLIHTRSYFLLDQPASCCPILNTLDAESKWQLILRLSSVFGAFLVFNRLVSVVQLSVVLIWCFSISTETSWDDCLYIILWQQAQICR